MAYFFMIVIDAVKPYAVIAAAGAAPITPKIPGVENDIVVQAFDVLSMKVKLNQGKAINRVIEYCINHNGLVDEEYKKTVIDFMMGCIAIA